MKRLSSQEVLSLMEDFNILSILTFTGERLKEREREREREGGRIFTTQFKLNDLLEKNTYFENCFSNRFKGIYALNFDGKKKHFG